MPCRGLSPNQRQVSDSSVGRAHSWRTAMSGASGSRSGAFLAWAPRQQFQVTRRMGWNLTCPEVPAARRRLPSEPQSGQGSGGQSSLAQPSETVQGGDRLDPCPRLRGKRTETLLELAQQDLPHQPQALLQTLLPPRLQTFLPSLLPSRQQSYLPPLFPTFRRDSLRPGHRHLPHLPVLRNRVQPSVLLGLV